ncbi:MAG TPA: iron ABC transporter permease [Myxococcota bacterium]|nr:iron ABC transporter permease [Myxococcota bacterium]
MSAPPLAGPRARPRAAAAGAATGVRRALRIWALLAGAAAACLVVALSVGAAPIALADVVRLLLRPDDSVAADVIHQLRLPRALAAFACGGLLACAGALMQVVLRNPLADPYVLGLSGGSAVGALGAMLLGLATLWIDLGAFLGALATVALVFAFARRDLARIQGVARADATPRLLLTGVILASGWSAIVAAILVVAPEAQLRGMLFWLMGDLGGAAFPATALLALPLVLLAVYPAARSLNVLLRGHETAHALGVPVVALRRRVLLAASLATAVAVTTAGAVGFIGLIVPHALRLAIGNDQRVLLPASVLAGGTLLLLADTAARIAFAPQQLPVGVVTALIGVPTFLYLVLRRGGAA